MPSSVNSWQQVAQHGRAACGDVARFDQRFRLNGFVAGEFAQCAGGERRAQGIEQRLELLREAPPRELSFGRMQARGAVACEVGDGGQGNRAKRIAAWHRHGARGNPARPMRRARLDGDRPEAHARSHGDRRIERVVEGEIGAHGAPAAITRLHRGRKRGRDGRMPLKELSRAMRTGRNAGASARRAGLSRCSRSARSASN